MVSSWCDLAWWDKLCPDAYLWRPKVNKGESQSGPSREQIGRLD
jgi:hypothetical protein